MNAKTLRMDRPVSVMIFLLLQVWVFTKGINTFTHSLGLMLICWQHRLFNAYWGLKGKTTPPLKQYKCTLMLWWYFPAACPGGVVNGDELMQQNIDKTPEGKPAAVWQRSCTWEKFSFYSKGCKKNAKQEWFQNNSAYASERPSQRLQFRSMHAFNCLITLLIMLHIKAQGTCALLKLAKLHYVSRQELTVATSDSMNEWMWFHVDILIQTHTHILGVISYI